MAGKFLDSVGLSHLWAKLKSYFVKGNARVFYGTCDTAAATVEKAVTCANFTASDLVEGAVVYVKFSVANTAAVASITMNVNGTGAYRIRCIRNGAIVDLPAVGYLAVGQVLQFTFTGTVWTMSVDYNTNTNTIGEYAGGIFAGPNGCARYSLAIQVDDELFESVVLTSTTAATKRRNPSGFLINSPMYYVSATGMTSGNSSSYSTTWMLTYGLDSRYVANVNTSWSAGAKPFYLVGTISEGSDGRKRFYLHETKWWANALPDTADGLYYWQIGRIHDKYKYVIHENHPIYYVDSNGVVQELLKVPVKASEVINDANLVTDSSYVHTDNNFTNAYKNAIDNVGNANTIDDALDATSSHAVKNSVIASEFASMEGQLNDLNNSYVRTLSTGITLLKHGKTVIIEFSGTINTNVPSAIWTAIGSVASTEKPATHMFGTLNTGGGGGDAPAIIFISKDDGSINLYHYNSATQNTFWGQLVYFVGV